MDNCTHGLVAQNVIDFLVDFTESSWGMALETTGALHLPRSWLATKSRDSRTLRLQSFKKNRTSSVAESIGDLYNCVSYIQL